MYIPKIPNNSLTKEIKRITELCESKINEYGEDSSWFEPGMSEADIHDWEISNNILIPSLYKEWLLFSEESQIRNNLARFYKPDDFLSNINRIPNDLIIVGELMGDGELLCISKSDNKLVVVDHDNIEDADFREILKDIIRILEDKSGLSMDMQELLMKMLNESKEK